MKKKVLALLMVVVCLTMGSVMPEFNVKAEEVGQYIDISYLLENPNTLIGTAGLQTWGVYLGEGRSLITNLGDNNIACGGITQAKVECTVSVTVVLERNVNGSWVCVTSWTVTEENTKSVVTSKGILVGSNYWYRTRCTHSAGSDGADSCTNALWMP